ncbi:MAG: hypothetical protein ACI9Y1_000355 [Lentisphaeria bacterium]|jgi:hypothetical protein
MENAVHYQEIIGTDNKNNSFFTVCGDPQQPGNSGSILGSLC